MNPSDCPCPSDPPVPTRPGPLDPPLIGDVPLPHSREELREALAGLADNRSFRVFAGANAKAVLAAYRAVTATRDDVADAVLAELHR